MPATSGSAHPLVAGRYVVERVLGEGATAVVFLARDTEGGRMVALKVLRPELAESAANARFLREIRRTGQLHHPHILPVLDVGETDGRPYFVLPHMEGGTLRQRLKRENQLPIADAIAITRTIAEALDYAHGRGLIHRDVKPENILFTGGQACLGDFGIARALETVYGEAASTSANVVRGTPAYMSPEQAAGSESLDGRSDVYSLACVFYEMVTGMQAFMGPTPESVIAMRFAHPPREMRVYRPGAPASFEAVLQKALAMAPADRFGTALEFALALEAAEGEIGPRVRGTRWKARALAAAGLLMVVLTVQVARARVSAREETVAPLDTARIAVLPFESDGSAAVEHHEMIRQALGRWQDINLVDPFQVADAIRRTGGIGDAAGYEGVAVALRAGRYVRGRANRVSGGWRISASLFDAANDRALSHYVEQVPDSPIESMAAYSRLADSLLLRGSAAAPSAGAVVGTASLAALQAFGRGLTSLDQWDLLLADSAFASAVTLDPQYARAALWLANVRAWQAMPVSSWAAVAQRALVNREQLTDREQRIARALVALGDRDFDAACAAYESLRQRSETDFAAWFGLGQCRALNRTVVADPSSPSGWSFASSARAATDAFRTAFELLPSTHRGFERGAFDRVRTLLLVSTNLVSGVGKTDGAVFLARPGIVNDTFALIPYPWEVIAAGGPASIPPGHARAIEARRREFMDIAARWSAAFPASAGAKQAVALALELLGDARALDTLRRARELEPHPGRRTDLAAREVLLRARLAFPAQPAALAGAVALSDSLLSAPAAGSDPSLLAQVAVLRGRCAQAVALIGASPPGSAVGLPTPVVAESQRLFALTAAGCEPPRDTILRFLAMTEAALTDRDPREQARARDALASRVVLLRAALDSALVTPIEQGSEWPVLRAAAAALRGDARQASAELAARGGIEPLTPDVALASARVFLHLRDTASATETLDRMFRGASQFDPKVLGDQLRAGAFVQAGNLMAALARARGGQSDAARWSVAARMLWSAGR